MSAQCIYCQTVRAKNTSRQRQHLLECQNYLAAMKEHNPQNPILELAANGTPTPAMKASKKRDYDSMGGSAITGTPAFQGEVPGARPFPIPRPSLERDFQMSVQLNPKIPVGQTLWGETSWISFISGYWSARWGKGTVVVRFWRLRSAHTHGLTPLQPGGQDKQLVAKDLSTKLTANYLLQTHDHPPAYITVLTDGWRCGPPEVLEKLNDPMQADSVDPKQYSFRLYIHMETGDQRYKHLNVGMWVASGMRRSTEVIYDAYRVN